jgi:glycosyltransferase involved in cell wall biosynthesis
VRIAIAVHNFPPEFTGGTEQVVLALAKAYRRKGHDVLVLAGTDASWDGREAIHEEGTGVPVVRLPRRPDEPYGLDLSRPRLVRLVDAILERERTEFLHVHHWSTLHGSLVRAAREHGIAAGVTLHDLWVGCPRFFRRPPRGIRCPAGSVREPCIECLQRDLAIPDAEMQSAIAARDAELAAELSAATFVTVPSRAARALITRHLAAPPRLTVIPHGLLQPAYAGRAVARKTGPFRIGTFGNLVPEKGVDLLVEACGGMAGIELHLFGPFLDDGFRQALSVRAATLSVHLVTHGPYGPLDPHPAASLDLAVFPSLCQETYGLVVDEALAQGVPVVVSERGALAERIGHGGIVVHGGGVEPLRIAIARVVRERGLLAALRAGVPRDLGSIDDAAQAYLSLLRPASAPT